MHARLRLGLSLVFVLGLGWPVVFAGSSSSDVAPQTTRRETPSAKKGRVAKKANVRQDVVLSALRKRRRTSCKVSISSRCG